MVLPLPSALANFSKNAVRNIAALDAITKAVPNPQSAVRNNVSKAVTKSVTNPGDIFNGASDIISDESSRFLESTAAPASLSPSLQSSSLSAISGTSLTSGPAIDSFLEQNVRMEDVLPAHQIFQISKNLGAHSMYTDPLQAYAQVTEAARDISNLCREAHSIVSRLLVQIAELVTLQGTLDYHQITAMNREFFGDAGVKANNAITLLNVVNTTFNTRGRHDPTQIADLCDALDELTKFVMFANSQFAKFESLRRQIVEGMNRLLAIMKEMAVIIDNVIEFLPEYAASVLFGKIFQAVQGAVLKQSGIDLQRILNALVAFSGMDADDRAKVLLATSIGAIAQVIKAYICTIQPSTGVFGGEPIINSLKSGYDSMTSILKANPINDLLNSFEESIDPFSSAMNTGLTRDNSSEMSSSASNMSSILSSIAVTLTAICAGTDTFSALFREETSLDPSRVTGANELFSDIGADAARDVLMSRRTGDFTGLSVTESTTPGQLAESLRREIERLPEGPQRDALIESYNEVYARHRATVLSMDFQRREDVRTFLEPVNEEADRKLINDIVQQHSGEDFSKVQVFLR